MVVIDWGAQLDGYCSDCTRTVAVGDPGGEAGEIYELVLEAQLAGVRAVAAGRGTREIDGIAREVIEAGGHGEEFGHGLGHGVGLDIHEAPTLSRRAPNQELEAGKQSLAASEASAGLLRSCRSDTCTCGGAPPSPAASSSPHPHSSNTSPRIVPPRFACQPAIYSAAPKACTRLTSE